VGDARFWQERTRRVEDRLSDALHERLTQEFVDRTGIVVARHGPSELLTSVAADGEVAVQGLRAGTLEGFRFRADAGGGDGSRALVAAANRALRELVRERVAELERDPDPAFALGSRAELLWRGAAVAALATGESVLEPRVEVASSDLIDSPLRERVRRRLASWLDAHLRQALAPLFSLLDSAPAGAARGLAFALAEGAGAAARRDVSRQVNALGTSDRAALARLGVSLGRFAVFVPALQRSDAMRLRARLFAVRRGLSPEAGPAGVPSAAYDPALSREFYLACGYFPAGPRVVRLDRLERAAAMLARLSRAGPFASPRELPGILGIREDELAAVLAALGYVARDGRFEQRAGGGSRRR